MAPRTAHYVLSSHWDREWYQTFQDYRYRLVKMIDRLLDGWASGRLRGPFQCDGQAILLDDYLEARPEKTEEIRRHVRDGNFRIGPWYVMPDEFLVSGESLVRNLQLGCRRAADYGGEPSCSGFICDIFGHNSQMPQLFAGFGIRAAYVWRGTNLIDTRWFRWIGADGTEMPAYRFGFLGYSDYAHRVRRADYSDGKNPKDRFKPDAIRENLSAFIKEEAERTPVEPVLLFDGGDHQEWDDGSYEILMEEAAKADAPLRIRHTDLDAVSEQAWRERERIGRESRGELREAGAHPSTQDSQWLIPGVLSSRVWIKQENAACEDLLCLWAEPWSVFARRAASEEILPGLLDQAWTWLLQNHPHDSICGCSIDAVHEDMKFRFRQARGIAQRLTEEAHRAIAVRVGNTLDDGAVRTVLFNPLPCAEAGPVEFELDLPQDWPTYCEGFCKEARPTFRLTTESGEAVTYQALRVTPGQKRIATPRPGTDFVGLKTVWRVRVAADVAVPSCGYVSLVAHRPAKGEIVRPAPSPSLLTGPARMENRFLRVEAQADGTLSVLDKRNGEEYRKLLAFEDQADIGDGWYHGIAMNDQTFRSGGGNVQIAEVACGPLQATLRVRVTMRLPDAFDAANGRVRSETFRDLVIDSFVTLRRDASHVEIETRVDNTIRDHRLRVAFPTGTGAITYLADSAFDVVERPVALPLDNHVGRELNVEERPQRTWTAVSGNGRGLAVVSSGLLESAVRDEAGRPIVLTLYRSTSQTVFTNGEPGGQLLQPLSFRYWIAPLAGEPEPAALFTLAQRLGGGIRSCRVTGEDVPDTPSESGTLPDNASFFRSEGGVVVTAMTPHGDGMAVRAFNPNPAPTEATFHIGSGLCPWSAVEEIDLRSRAVSQGGAETFAIDNGTLRATFAPKQIRTFLLHPPR